MYRNNVNLRVEFSIGTIIGLVLVAAILTANR